MNYRGYIAVSHVLESRCFVNTLDSDKFYWVEYETTVDPKVLENMQEPMVKINDWSVAIEVEVEGEKLHGGRFGHLSQYDKCLRISRIIKFSAEELGKRCSIPP